MRFEKQDLFALQHCYSVKSIEMDGNQYAVFSTEATGPAICVDSDGNPVSRIWEETGGNMCIVPIPGENGNLLAVQKFYYGFRSTEAAIVYCRRTSQTDWDVQKLFDIPYIHRFDLLKNGDRLDFIGGTLCRSKKFKDDWSDPGYIIAGRLGQNVTAPIELRIIQSGLTKHHGYGKLVRDGIEHGLFAAEEGVFLATPPVNGLADWNVERIFDQPTSEARLFDLNGDGVDELITIEDFHGPHFKVYQNIDGQYQLAYACDMPIDFCHVIWTGLLRGKPCVIGACRRGIQNLFLLTWQNGAGYQITTIDEHVGPTNVDVIPGKDFDIIASANREAHYATYYRVYD